MQRHVPLGEASLMPRVLGRSRGTPTAGNKGTHQQYVLVMLNGTPRSGVISPFLFLGRHVRSALPP